MSDHHDEPVEELRRWAAAGGEWRVLARTGDAVTVGLFTCDGGEEMGRLSVAAAALEEHERREEQEGPQR